MLTVILRSSGEGGAVKFGLAGASNPGRHNFQSLFLHVLHSSTFQNEFNVQMFIRMVPSGIPSGAPACGASSLAAVYDPVELSSECIVNALFQVVQLSSVMQGKKKTASSLQEVLGLSSSTRVRFGSLGPRHWATY